MTNDLDSQYLYSKIAELLSVARKNVIVNVNRTMVYTYFEIGRMIVEDEQNGARRAEYGKRILKELSKKLITDFGKGFSERNLEQMRNFYLSYSISQKASAEFNLSWSHYCKDKSQTLVDITLPEDNDQIFASRYQTVLPDKETWIELLNEEKKVLES